MQYKILQVSYRHSLAQNVGQTIMHRRCFKPYFCRPWLSARI